MSLLTEIVAAFEDGDTDNIPAEIARQLSHVKKAVDEYEQSLLEQLAETDEDASTEDETETVEEN